MGSGSMVNEDRIRYTAQNIPVGETRKITCDVCRTQGKSDLSLSVTNKGDSCAYKCHRCNDVAGVIQYIPRESRAPAREASPPPVKKEEPTQEQSTSGQLWIENERKIPYDKVKDHVEFGSAYFSQVRKSLPCVEFIYKNEEGKRVYSKFRAIEGKYFSSGTSLPGGTDTLYLTETVDYSKPYLIITEGELDALVMRSLGMNAVSIPTGANIKWLKHNQNLLQKFRMVLMWFDADAKGGTVSDKLKAADPKLTKNFRYMNPKKLAELHPGCKDANDIAKAVEPAALDAALKKVCNSCFDRHVPEYVIRASSLLPSLVRIRDNTYANRIPINEQRLDDILSFVPGYAGVVTGLPGSGKSSWLSWYAYKRASIYGHKTVFWSPENDPALLYADLLGISAGRVVQGHAGVLAMTDQEISTQMKFVEDHFRVVQDSEESSDIDTILNQMYMAASDMGGADIYVIDPFNFIKLPDVKNQLDSVKVIFSKIRRFAVANKCFVALVAHPRKQNEKETPRKSSDDMDHSRAQDEGIKQYSMPGMYSISGSADFANMADLIVTIHREESRTIVATSKSRRPFLGSVGTCDLLFRPESGRFRILSRSHTQSTQDYTREPF